MFTFSEMLALVQSESSFGAYVCHRRPAGLYSDQRSCFYCVLYIMHCYCFNQCIAHSSWQHHFVGSVVHHPAVLLNVSNTAVIASCDNSLYPFPMKLAEVKIVQLTSHPSLWKKILVLGTLFFRCSLCIATDEKRANIRLRKKLEIRLQCLPWDKGIARTCDIPWL